MSEKDFKKELKNCYKDGSNFSKVLFTLMYGDTSNKIEKDLKEAYKLLKHEEKNKKSKVLKKDLYNNLVIVSTSLNLTEETREYKEKYYRSCLHLLTDKRIKLEGLKTMTDICFNKAFNLKNKLIDKKYLEDAIVYFKSYLKEVKNVNYLYLKERTTQLVKQTFSSDEYGHKHLYLVHIIDNRNKELINSFKQSDYVEYYLLLKDKELTLEYDKDLFRYLRVVCEYKFLKKDSESALEYARYHLANPRFVYAKEDYFSLINCVYKLGYKEAFKDIYSYYLNKFDKTNVYKTLESHYKKHKDDKENLIKCSEEILSRFIVNDTPLKEMEKPIKLALQILEENTDKLTKEQLEKLSLLYEKGIGGKKDINKAKLYKNYNPQTKEISDDVKLLLSKIKPINEYYKDEVEEIINKMMSGKEEDIFNAIALLAYASRVHMDNDLLFYFANKYVASYPSLTPFLASCYLVGKGVEKDLVKYNELKEICYKNNYEIINQIHYDYLLLNAKKDSTVPSYIKTLEEDASKGVKYAKYKLVMMMLEEGYLPFDEDKINQYVVELEEVGYEIASTYFSAYYAKKNDYDKAFKYAKIQADKYGGPLMYNRLYKINITNDFKYMSKKETLSCLLKASGNDPDGVAHYDIARHYLKGDLAPKNVEKARKFFLKAAELNNNHALSFLLDAYRYGQKDLNIEQDVDTAYMYYEKMDYENKEEDYSTFLTELYLNEKSKHYDPKKGMELLISKYEASKDPNLALNIFYQYYEGINVKADNVKAEHYIKLAMEGGVNRAYYSYGVFLVNRISRSTETIEEAVKIMKKTNEDEYNSSSFATLAKYCYLIYRYKDCYNYATKSIKLDDKNADAHYYLGILYADGKYVENDKKEAKKHLLIAAENGNIGSYYSLALLTYLDKPFDEKKFLEYIDKVLKINNANAHNLYCDYLVYFKKDYKRAYEYIEDHMDTLEHSRIRADMFYYGYYVNADFEKAFKIYSSLKKPAPSVLVNLGFCYYYGKGVKEDKHLAIQYVKQSAEKGCLEAIEFLKEKNID